MYGGKVMLAYKEKTNIILLGDLKQCKICYYKYRSRYNIVGFSDMNNNERGSIYGITQYCFEDLKVLFGAKIIVISWDWFKICKKLEEIGHRFYFDFLPYHFFDYKDINLMELYNLCDKNRVVDVLNRLMNGKEGCILHGNCQMGATMKYLSASKSFTSKYIIIKTPPAFAYTNYAVLENREIFKNITLLLEVYINENNSYSEKVSTVQFEKIMPDSCKKVIIPNFWFEGYFPQHTKNQRNVLTDVDSTGLFYWGDKNINELVQKYRNADTILKIVSDENYYSKDELTEHFEKSFENILEREKLVDIKMYDYIYENYKKDILFYSSNHPVNSVIKELVKRILVYLQLEDKKENIVFEKEKFLDSKPLLKAATETVYPSVQKFLGGNYDEWTYAPPTASLKTSFFTEEPNFEECIREMLNNCFGII